VAIEPDEFSFGRSFNRGCQAANGDFVVITSAHVYPLYNDWLEKILTPFGNLCVALVYGKQRGDEATKYSEHQIFFKLFPEQSNCEQKDLFCNNANAAIGKSLWKEVPYDETLTGLEDLDWAKRVMQMGYKIAYASDAEVVHVHNEPALCIYNRYRREGLALTRITP
jgi:GT2 family glycosyltransferase